MGDIVQKFEGHSPLITILKFSLPSSFGAIIGLLCVLTDRYFIGQVAGREGMAAVALVFPYAMIINSFNFLFSGIAVNVGVSLGEGKKALAEKYLTSGFLWISVIGIGLSIILWIFNTPLLYIFGASDSNIAFAKDYTKFLIPIAVFQIFLGQSTLIRGIGDSVTAMGVNICTGVINVILDYIFILKLNMGISGAALATLIATAISATYVLIYFFFSKDLSYNKNFIAFDKKIIKNIFIIGSPRFYNQLLQSSLITITNRQAGFYGGDLATAAIGIISICRNIISTSMQGFNQGASAIISYNFGARKFSRVIKTFKIQLLVVSFISGSILLVMLTHSKLFVSFFVKNDLVLIDFAAKNLRINLCLMVFTGLFLACNNLFQSIKENRVATRFFLIRILVLNIPLTYILPLFLGELGVWIAFPISDTIVALLILSLTIKELSKLPTDKES